jgi:radical SAM protein with 4Fe4S-binding SPASM domain
MHRFSPYKVLHNLDLAHQSLRDPCTPPIHVQLDLSENCNHNCVFCFFSKDASNTGMKRQNIAKGIGRRSLRTRELVSIISEIGQLGTRAITLVGGGEPLMHPKLEAVLEAIVSAEIEYGVITNGTVRINGRVLELLGKATWIRVSLDAALAKTYARVHRPKNLSVDNFESTLRNLRTLREQCPNTDLGASFLIHPYNISEIARGAELCSNIGLDYIQYKPVYTKDRGDEVRPLLAEIKAQVDTARQMESEHFKVIPLLGRLEDIAKPTREYEKCRIHLLNTQIGVDGKLYPCCVLKYVEDYSYGSIYEHSFSEIWASKKRTEVMKALDPADCPPCWYDKTNEVLDYLAAGEVEDRDFV